MLIISLVQCAGPDDWHQVKINISFTTFTCVLLGGKTRIYLRICVIVNMERWLATNIEFEENTTIISELDDFVCVFGFLGQLCGRRRFNTCLGI